VAQEKKPNGTSPLLLSHNPCLPSSATPCAYYRVSSASIFMMNNGSNPAGLQLPVNFIFLSFLLKKMIILRIFLEKLLLKTHV